MFTVHPALLLSIIIVFASCSKQRGKEVLAELDTYTVTELEVQKKFQEYYERSGKAITPDIRTMTSILESEIEIYALAKYAIDLELDVTPEAQTQIQMIERGVVIDQYLDQEVKQGIYSTDKELRELFERINTRIRASHLYAKTQEEADKLHMRLRKGESFEALAAEVFNTHYLARNGGDIGFFEVDQMDVAFEEAAHRLTEGEFSKPVRTAQGYSIIKVTSKNRRPILTEFEFNTLKPRIEYLLLRQKQDKALREHMYSFVDNLVINEDELELMHANMQSADQGGVDASLYDDGGEPLAVLGSNRFYATDIASELQINSRRTLDNLKSIDDLRNSVKGVAYRLWMLKEAERFGITKSQDTKYYQEESAAKYFARTAVEHLEKSISVSEQEMEDVYNEQPLNYRSDLELRLQRIVLSTEKEAEIILEKITAGESFSELIKSYTTKNEDLMTEGDLGFLPAAELGFNGIELSKLDINQVSGILHYQTNEFHIYKCLDRIESRKLSYDEAKPQIEDALKAEKLKELRAQVVKEVKDKYNVFIDMKKLEELNVQI